MPAQTRGRGRPKGSSTRDRMDDPLYVEFGKRVKAARRSAELTQAELAKAIGLTRTSVANIEAGRQRAFLDTVYGIADAVRCAPQELLPDATALRAELPAAVGSQPDDVQQWILDTARLDLHDTADTLRRLDAELVQARRLVREAWTAAAAAAQVLGTDEHLPACEQAASLAVAS